MRDLAVEHALTAVELCEEWMAYAAIDSRVLTDASCEELAVKLAGRPKPKGDTLKKKSRAAAASERRVLTRNDIDEL